MPEISCVMNNLGLNIRKIREQRGFSQEYVATQLGINQSTYGKMERDASGMPIDRLYKISEVLDTDLTKLLDICNKNIINHHSNMGNGYVETINNDFKSMIAEIKDVYEKVIASKDEQITFLKKMIEKN